MNVNLLTCPKCGRVGVQLFGHEPRQWIHGTGDPEAEGTHVHVPDVDHTFPAVAVALRAIWTVFPRVAVPDRAHIIRDQLVRLEGDGTAVMVPMALQDHDHWGRLNGLGMRVSRHMGSLAAKRYQHEGRAEPARIWGEFVKMIKGE